MCAPISQSPQGSLILIWAKARVALMLRVGLWSAARGEMQGGFSASSEDQFLGVEVRSMLLTPSLGTRRTACSAAPVWHGQSFTNQCASHILTVDEQ